MKMAKDVFQTSSRLADNTSRVTDQKDREKER